MAARAGFTLAVADKTGGQAALSAKGTDGAAAAGAAGSGNAISTTAQAAASQQQQPAQAAQEHGKLGNAAFATGAALSSSSSNSSVSSSRRNSASRVEAAGAEDCRPSLVIVLTSHKTGTAQAGCITEMLEQRYVMQGAARHDHHPPNLHAVSEFAGQRLQTQFSGGIGAGGLYCPSVKFYSSGHHLPRVEDEACPGTLPCPCRGEREECLSVEAGTIDIPSGSNTTVVQVIRSPINVVLSAYQYHIQDPAPEEWLEHMSMQNFTGWMYTGGVPYEALDSLGAHSTPRGESFYSFLRRLPPELGVKLQFWMSAWELYGFARQHKSLAAQAASPASPPGMRLLSVRFEDLQSSFNDTARGLLEAFKERMPALDVDGLLEEVQACHISNWNPAHLAFTFDWQHVTSSRDPALRARLRRVLMADQEIAPRLCQLSAMFGYTSEPECGGAATGKAGESGGPPTGG